MEQIIFQAVVHSFLLIVNCTKMRDRGYFQFSQRVLKLSTRDILKDSFCIASFWVALGGVAQSKKYLITTNLDNLAKKNKTLSIRHRDFNKLQGMPALESHFLRFQQSSAKSESVGKSATPVLHSGIDSDTDPDADPEKKAL